MKMIFIQSIGFVAIILTAYSMFCKKKKDMMHVQLISNLLYALQYFFLHAYDAIPTSIISIVRSFYYGKYANKRNGIPKIIPFILIIASLVVGSILYDGILSLIPMFISIAYTISSYYKNIKFYRITFLICGCVWLVYNYYVQAYVCILGNILEIVSSSVYLYKHKKGSKRRSK